MQNFSGMGSTGSFYWWEGVVENNIDPRGAGRCQVRIIGHNTPLKLEERHDEFPWAYPIMPLNNPHGKIVALKPGTRVFGFFRDGASAQDCVMLGTINIGFENPGASDNFDESAEPDYNINLGTNPERVGDYGFVDDRKGSGGPISNQPQKTKVTMDASTSSYENITDYGPLKVNEINTPRLARGDMSGTITKSHSGALSAVRFAFSGIIPEPANPYATLYPFNAVEESDSGHVKEVDDTPGAERIKETHRTGTFYEIHPDGTKVTKVVKDDFSVTIGDKGVKVEGVCAVHVAGTTELYCESDINAHGLKQINVLGENKVVIDSHGPMSVLSTGKMTINSKNDIALIATGVITMADRSATTVNVDELQEDNVIADTDPGGSGETRTDTQN